MNVPDMLGEKLISDTCTFSLAPGRAGSGFLSSGAIDTGSWALLPCGLLRVAGFFNGSLDLSSLDASCDTKGL